MGSNSEKCENFRKNGRFSGRIWPDWGNTAWADMAGLGSIGLILLQSIPNFYDMLFIVFPREECLKTFI